MKEISLTMNQVALVDDEDFEWLMRWKWIAFKCSGGRRMCARMSNRQKTQMHRLITSAPKGLEVDHMNGNTLDNRRSNLRIVTRSENAMNCYVRTDSRTGVKGVEFKKDRNKYSAYYSIGGRKKFVGYFDDLLEAGRAQRAAFSAALGKPYEEICPKLIPFIS
jgi:HNH endonuclease